MFPPNHKVIGKCSICGGDVVKNTGPMWMVGEPPPPTCMECGAIPAEYALPVIDMIPRPKPRYYWDTRMNIVLGKLKNIDYVYRDKNFFTKW